MKQTANRLIFKISLLSISLFLMMAPQISSALPLMYQAFPGVNQSSIEMLSTIPNFGIIVGLVLSPILIRLMKPKYTVLLGLFITLISGTVPIYISSYFPILFSRFLLGVGIGLFNSLAVSMIPKFYKDNEEQLATMLGFQNVMGSIGAAVSSFLVGYLVTISWHAAFAIYLLVIPSLVLFYIFIPNDNLSKSKQVSSDKQAASIMINAKVILIAALMFIIFTFYMPIAYKLPVLITQERLGTLPQAAFLAGISSLLGIPLGASFGYFFKKLHDKIFPIGFGLVTFGFFILSSAVNILIVFIAMIIIGFGFGLGVPYMYNWLAWVAPEGAMNLATTIVLVMVNIGCFISPYLLNWLTAIFGQNTPRTTMLLSALAFGSISIYALLHYIKVHRLASVRKS